MTQGQKFLPRSYPSKKQRFVALLTAVIFILNFMVWSPVGLKASVPAPQQISESSEVGFLSHAALISTSDLAIPSELGTVEYSSRGRGTSVFHIQTAHGHYEAQKQIQSLLHYLDKNYGVKTLMVEGSAFELDPELIRFFPRDKALTMEAANELAKRALIKGPELYLLEADGAKAYGIEELQSYRGNGFSFVNVLKKKQKTQAFLSNMDQGIERLSSHYLNKDLRDFLKNLEAFEENQTSFGDGLAYLKRQASKYLDMDLGDTGYQIDWPMLVRVFKIHELSGKLDKQAFQKAKELFLKAIRGISDQTYSDIASLLNDPNPSRALPYPGTNALFEDMVRQLPRDFSYEAFPDVKHFITCLLLQSELKAPLLIGEAQRLTEKITQKLVQNQDEQKLIAILKDYRLLRKLFALELLPADYETLLARQGELNPSAILPRFLAINSAKRVKNVEFDHIAELDELFAMAMKFYAGVKDRDGAMERRIEERLKQTGADKVAVITGGFHANPFRDYFASKGFSYALITPKLTGMDEKGHENYVKNMLRFTADPVGKSTRETVFLSDAKVMVGNIYGVDTVALRSEVREVLTATANKQGMRPARAVPKTAEQSAPMYSSAERHSFRFGKIGAAIALAAAAGIFAVSDVQAVNYQITPTPGLTVTNLTNPKLETVQPIGPAIVSSVSNDIVKVASGESSDTNTIKGLTMTFLSPQNFANTNIVIGFAQQFAGKTASLKLKDVSERTSTNRVQVMSVASSNQFYQIASSKFEGLLDLTKITAMTVTFDVPLNPQDFFAMWKVLLGGIGQLPARITKIRDLGAGGVEITFTTQVGANYGVEQTSDLKGAWSPVSGVSTNATTTETTVIIPKSSNPQFMRVPTISKDSTGAAAKIMSVAPATSSLQSKQTRKLPRSEMRLQPVATAMYPDMETNSLVSEVSAAEQFLMRTYYPGILPLQVYEKAIAVDRSAAVRLAMAIFEQPIYAEGILEKQSVKRTAAMTDQPKVFKNFPQFGLAQGILLATETGKISDGLVFSPKFAFERRGAIAAARTVLGDIPLAVIVQNQKEQAFLDDLNLKLVDANRPGIFAAKSPEEAVRYLRSKKATRLKALFDESEKNDLLAIALRNQLSDMMFVNDAEFQGFMNYAGMEIARLVGEVQARFAFARSA